MLILGHGLYGGCDFVPGRFHVATRFFTVFLVPLIPIEGFIVLEDRGTTFRGVKIPISVKSLALAWGRAALWAPGIALFLAGLYQLYCYFAGERVAGGELAKFLGGGTLLVVLAAASMLVGFKASFLRAIQLGMAAGFPPETIAADYGKPLPSDDVLQRLAQAIRPTVEETGTTLGPVGRVISFLILGWLGTVLFIFGGMRFLSEGYRGWAYALWDIPAGIGLGLVWFGFSWLAPRVGRKLQRFVLSAIGIATIAAFIAGPWLSEWSWRKEEELAWKRYLAEVEAALDADKQFPYGTITRAPYALHRPAFFLVDLLSKGEGHFSLNDRATQAWHGNDPHFQAVKNLSLAIANDKEKVGPAKKETRQEQLKKYLPTLKAGGWPEDVK